MDDDRPDMIERLLAMAGSLLEDASAEAILIDATRRSARIETVKAAIEDAGRLVAVAEAIDLRTRTGEG